MISKVFLFTLFNLTAGLKKTQTMLLKSLSIDQPQSIVTVAGTPLTNVHTFRYLGSQISTSEAYTGDYEINYRINLANAKFKEIQHLLTKFHIDKATCLTYYNAFVRSRLCYSCSTWSLNAKQRNRLQTTYNSHMRAMVKGGFRRKGGARDRQDEVGYNRAYTLKNCEIMKILGAPDLVKFARNQQINWVAHVVRMENDRIVKQVLFSRVRENKM